MLRKLLLLVFRPQLKLCDNWFPISKGQRVHTDLDILPSEWSVIPKSVTQARIEKNFELDGWDLSDAEMKQLNGLTDRFKVCGDGWLPIRVFHGDDE